MTGGIRRRVVAVAVGALLIVASCAFAAVSTASALETGGRSVLCWSAPERAAANLLIVAAAPLPTAASDRAATARSLCAAPTDATVCGRVHEVTIVVPALRREDAGAVCARVGTP